MPTIVPYVGVGVAPQVVSADVIGSRVAVTFSEAMRADAALLDPANYTITEDLGSDARTVTGVVVDDDDTVLLTLDGALTAGDDNYNVAVDLSVADAAGNTIDPAADDVDFSGSAALPDVADWCDLGTSWLLAQFADQPRLRGLLCILLEQVQTLEQLAADMRDLRALDTARGAQLDEWGVRLGYPRDPLAMPDADYRRALQAVAMARVSSGSADDMIEAALSAGALSAGDISHLQDYPAGVLHTSEAAMSYEDGARTARITRISKPAGVRFALDYPPEGLPIVTFEDDAIHPLVSFADEGTPGSGGVWLERDSGA